MVGQKHYQSVKSKRGTGAGRESAINCLQKCFRFRIFGQILLFSGFGKSPEPFPLNLRINQFPVGIGQFQTSQIDFPAFD